MRNMRLVGFVAMVMIGVSAVTLASHQAAPPAKGQTAGQARLNALMKRVALKVIDEGHGVWSATFDADAFEAVTVVVSLAGDHVLAQARVKRRAALTDAGRDLILRRAYGNTLSRLVITPEGDVMAMAQSPVRLLDAAALTDLIREVAVVTDDTAGALSETTTPAPPPGPGPIRQIAAGDMVLSYGGDEWRAAATDGREPTLTHVSGDVVCVVEDTEAGGAEQRISDFLAGLRKDDSQPAAPALRSRPIGTSTLQIVETPLTLAGSRLFVGHYVAGARARGAVACIATASPFLDYRAAIEALVGRMTLR